ncbi:MAG: LPS export ABC transporter periplasmic protein LptC [Desulfobacca sp. 4484_104]|nr:MAG: LPS export ABC transporter periplasmic protein LptC [Desulfobacca sp. 4484_104]
MRKWLRRTLILGLVLGSALGLWLFIGPKATEKPVPPEASTNGQPAHMNEIRLTEIEDGVKKWVLVAKRADYLKDQNVIHLSDVEVEVFWKEGGNVKLSGDNGYINTKTRQLTLEGEVRAQVADYHFTSAHVTYIPKERALLARGKVEITSPQALVQGNDLRVELNHKSLVLQEHLLTRCRFSEKLWTR